LQARNSVTSEVVAIKKMSFTGKQSADKWQDIIKEVKFLRHVKHKNAIDYKGCYLKEHTAWLISSILDSSCFFVCEVHKKPLKEEEISAICQDALEGLDYLHSMGRIHRDVKAGNILLTESGTVKLGQLCCVCALYECLPPPLKVDVFTLVCVWQQDFSKITERIWTKVAERKPPYFNMNAMSALYHIAQNDSPVLTGGDWSDIFRNFVELCLQKNPCDRLDASELLQHLFITRSRAPRVILDLIQRTKAAVRELDNLNYRKMKKILMVDSQENEVLTVDAEEDSADDQAGGDSSKSNSIASTQSHQSGGVSAGSQGSSTSSLPPVSDNDSGYNYPPSLRGQRGNVRVSPSNSSTTSLNSTEVGANNFATIRTTSIVSRQIKEHEQENQMHEQMSGYKRMRRLHQKALIQLEAKCRQEMDEHKQKLDKEYENLLQQFSKELEKVQVKHQQDLERKLKHNLASEKRLSQAISKQHEDELKRYQQQQKNEYKQMKDRKKKEMGGDTPSRQRDDALRSHKEDVLHRQAVAVHRLQREQTDYHKLEIRKFRRRKLLQYHQLEQDLLREELNKRQSQLEQAHTMLLHHHDGTQELTYRQQRSVHQLKDEQVRKQHHTELANQQEYNSRRERELRKKHAMEVKQQPKSLKVRQKIS
ncbi:serine/threonine-protein kinase Tao-like, partial [Limulus polyphemus]|uniref:non-specific serine/threonine protein kinase n=1 Tax=Limulus polyphemus TaxID=6850 RepID=A0ABM1RW48_LIMPO